MNIFLHDVKLYSFYSSVYIVMMDVNRDENGRTCSNKKALKILARKPKQSELSGETEQIEWIKDGIQFQISLSMVMELQV
jgi:hypothetical protein